MTGIDGDYYLNTTTYDLFQKIAGTWTVVANLKGATGSQGPQGPQGVAGTQIYNGAGNPT
jgi:hypothetical protein